MQVEDIRQLLAPGTTIPRPLASRPYTVVGIVTSRGHEAIEYRIPMRPGSKKASRKRLPIETILAAEQVLASAGEITTEWFGKAFPAVEGDGHCNFVALGGALQLLGLATYAGPGVYSKA